MSECTHHWTTTSECPYCLRSELNEARRLVDGLGETMRVMNEVAQGWKQSAIKAEKDLAAARARVEKLEGAEEDRDEYQRQAKLYAERCAESDIELEAARADAERYRWLRGDVQDDFSTRWSRWRIEHWASPGPTWSDIRGADLDAAIDAALAGEKK